MKAEKRKLAECARYAREADKRVMAAARTTADTNSATTDKKLRNWGEKTDSFFSKARKIGKKVGRHTFKIEVKKAEKIAKKGEETRKKG